MTFPLHLVFIFQSSIFINKSLHIFTPQKRFKPSFVTKKYEVFSYTDTVSSCSTDYIWSQLMPWLSYVLNKAIYNSHVQTTKLKWLNENYHRLLTIICQNVAYIQDYKHLYICYESTKIPTLLIRLLQLSSYINVYCSLNHYLKD